MRESPEMAIYEALKAGAKVEQDSDEIKSMFKKAFRAKLTGARSGPVYTTYFFTNSHGQAVPIGERPPHQASAPGEAPAKDSGDLLQSFTYKDRRASNGASVTIEVGADYGAYLEFGTSKMRPRPFMRSTVKEQSNKLRSIWLDGIANREKMAARSMGGKG